MKGVAIDREKLRNACFRNKGFVEGMYRADAGLRLGILKRENS